MLYFFANTVMIEKNASSFVLLTDIGMQIKANILNRLRHV